MARQASVSKSITAPVGGWDTENALADMPEINAVVLDNFFPNTDSVELRKGFTEWSTGMTGNVETLMQYAKTDGTSEFYAVNDGNVYNISSIGEVGSPEVSGLTNSRFQYINFGNAAGSFLIAVNGEDTPLLYNGTTWSNTAISGVGLTEDNIVWINNHQNRLWFGEKDSLDAWYLDATTISGTATLFPLGGIAKLGGYIVGMGTWTRDSGEGSDDVAIFVTSNGEAIIYAGTDPSDILTWSLIGVFRIGKPIGRRGIIKAGADLVLITQDGFVTAQSILMTDRSQSQKVAISTQINSAVNKAVRQYSGLFGWEAFIYPQGTMLIFNIPQGGNKYHQYIFNTLTGKPCRFIGINANTFCLYGDNAFFGGVDGKVYKFDDGLNDNGSNIVADAIPAFSYFGSKGNVKSFKLADLLLISDGSPVIDIELNTDFQIKQSVANPIPIETTAGLWDSGLWDSGLWGQNETVFSGWRGITGIGRAASLRLRIVSKIFNLKWVATNFTFINGGQL